MYKSPQTKFSAMAIIDILLNPDIDSTKVACKRPIVTERNSRFVINVTKISHPDDIKKDALMDTQRVPYRRFYMLL